MVIKNNLVYSPQKRKRTWPIPRRIMAILKYSKREINRNFKVKVSGTYEGQKVSTLVGVNGLLRFVGDIDLTNRILDRAFNGRDDKCVCRLRRGIAISFYVY